MQRLRDLLRPIEDRRSRRRAERPTSLFEAGGTGRRDGAARPTRPGREPDAWFESGAQPTAEERTARRAPDVPQRRSSPAAPDQARLAARQIRAALRNPDSLRTAILLQEVLGPPVSRGPRKRR